jgi:large subunit ribosomal protein L32e
MVCDMARSYPRPRFVREESWRYKRVKSAWRSPRGKTSRVRRSKQGWPPVVKIGYSKPNAIKGMHPSGLREVIVYRPQDVSKVDPKTQAVRIAHTVGENKRVLILEELKKANIKVLNPGHKKAAEPEAAAEPTLAETEASKEQAATTTETESEQEKEPETSTETKMERESSN